MSKCNLTQRFWITSAFTWVLLAAPAQSPAEPFPLPALVPHNVPANDRSLIQSVAQQNADEMFNHLLLLIDEADRVGGLSDTQRKKLTVAAKGAVQNAVEEWLAPIIAKDVSGTAGRPPQPVARRIEGRPGVAIVEGRVILNGKIGFKQRAGVLEARRLELQLDLARKGKLVQGRQFAAPPFSSDGKATDQIIWTAAWKSTLTDNQRARIAALHTTRRDRPKTTRADKIVADIDERLLLDAGQRKKVTAIVEKFLESPVVRLRMLRQPNTDIAMLWKMGPAALVTHSLKELLSDAQLHYWERIAEPRKTVRYTR